jgi:single-stranded-DNA-specific exonuclease
VNTRWRIREQDGSQPLALAEKLQIPELLSRLLYSRGLTDCDQAWSFLNPSLDGLHDPFLMLGLAEVTARILRARDRQERVLIYGDYDVDGITSTVVFKRALEMIGIPVDYYLPKRLEEGYGLKQHVVKKAVAEGFELIITADSGIRAFEVCELARELGVDLIVTDHHLPDDRLPNAYAIVNPRQPDCPYPDKNLAAVGVVFKIVQALFKELGKESVTRHFLKLVAIGTLADLVPLIGENRIIAKFGLEGLSDPRNVGLKALLEGAGVEEAVSNFDVCFKVAPRMNAVTRMGGGREVVDLFSMSDASEAMSVVQEMNAKNLRRREAENQILKEILRRYEDSPGDFEKRFLVVVGRNWHRGVIGIVASRLVERFYRPVLVLSVDQGGGQGSGRSIPGFHLLSALDSCRDIFSKYGGHAQAVGCSLGPESCGQATLKEVAKRLESHANNHLTEEDLVPALDIDSLVPVERLDLSLYSTIQRLAPFGVGNPVPLFASRRATVVQGPWLLKDQHLKFRVQENGSPLDVIWWRHGEAAELIRPGSHVDLAYTLSRDVFRGVEKLTLTLRDMKVSSST